MGLKLGIDINRTTTGAKDKGCRPVACFWMSCRPGLLDASFAAMGEKRSRA